MVRILVLSFLFKGESFSFVRGLWLWDLNNRRTFLWIFSRSALHLMFSNGDWKIFSFLALWKFLWDLYFLFANIVLPIGGHFGWIVFAGGPQFAWFSSSWIKGFSLVSLWSMITPFYFLVAFGFFISYWKIWYCWRLLMQDRGRIGGLWLTSFIEIIGIFQNWSG